MTWRTTTPADDAGGPSRWQLDVALVMLVPLPKSCIYALTFRVIVVAPRFSMLCDALFTLALEVLTVFHLATLAPICNSPQAIIALD